jgi:hypothetical protein
MAKYILEPKLVYRRGLVNSEGRNDICTYALYLAVALNDTLRPPPSMGGVQLVSPPPPEPIYVKNTYMPTILVPSSRSSKRASVEHSRRMHVCQSRPRQERQVRLNWIIPTRLTLLSAWPREPSAANTHECLGRVAFFVPQYEPHQVFFGSGNEQSCGCFESMIRIQKPQLLGGAD